MSLMGASLAMNSEQQFLIRNRTYTAGDPRVQVALAEIYGSAERPRCLCVAGGIDMYVAKLDQYVIKRMPDSGCRHHPSCPSFEPEPGSSGLAELLGDAVVERSPEVIEVYLDFPLSRVSGRPAPCTSAEFVGDVLASRRRISLRALVHLLWERAGFHRWAPAMHGKRSWLVLRHHLLHAASDLRAKGAPLRDCLFLPEAFKQEQQALHSERCRTHLAQLHQVDDDNRFRMMVLIGEFREVESTGYGRRVWIKHLPECPLLIDEKTWARAERVYAPQFEARSAEGRRGLRLVMVALIYARREGVYQIDTLSCMLTTDQWIPVDGVDEYALVQQLTERGRRFLKPLRYDAKSTAVYPNVLLLDTGPFPTKMHVISVFADPKNRAAIERAIKEAQSPTWAWTTSDPMPAFPPLNAVTAARATATTKRRVSVPVVFSSE